MTEKKTASRGTRAKTPTKATKSSGRGGVGFKAETGGRGGDYDYKTARQAGMGPDGKGRNAGHWGSVAPPSAHEKKKHALPEGTYKILKAKQHPTFDKAVAAENRRGSDVVKKGDRYYSVPRGSKSPSSPNTKRTTRGSAAKKK